MSYLFKPLFLDKWTKSAKCSKHVFNKFLPPISIHTPGSLDSHMYLRVGVEVVYGGTRLAIFPHVIQSNNIV